MEGPLLRTDSHARKRDGPREWTRQKNTNGLNSASRAGRAGALAQLGLVGWARPTIPGIQRWAVPTLQENAYDLNSSFRSGRAGALTQIHQ
jgi:hypothetical protein